MFYPDQFVKLTNYDGINNGFQYKEGINECSSRELYFFRFKDVCHWISAYGDALIWKVEMPEGEKVIEYKNKCQAKRIILREPKKAYKYNEICKMAVQQNGLNLKYVREQTEEICEMALKQNFHALRYVINQTPKLCKSAIEENGCYLKYVKNQTPELCKLAVEQNGYAIKYVGNQTLELCKLALQQNGCNIKNIFIQRPELCKLAVEQNGLALEYIMKQTLELCKLAVKQCPNAVSFVNQEFKYLFQ